MCCEPRHLTVALNAALARAGILHRAFFVPAEDPESTDDEIELRLLGAPTSFSVQVGPYGIALNEYTYRNGRLNGMRTLRDFDSAPYQRVVDAVLVELQKRLVAA